MIDTEVIEFWERELLNNPTEYNASHLMKLYRIRDMRSKRRRLGLSPAPRLPHNRGVA